MKKLYNVVLSAQTLGTAVFATSLCLAETREEVIPVAWEEIVRQFPLPKYYFHEVDAFVIPEESILAAGYVKAEDKDETIKKLEAKLAAEQLAHNEYRKQAEESYGVWRIEIEALENRVNWYKLMWKEANDMMVRLADKHKKLSDIVRQALTPEQYHAARKIVENEP